MVYPVPDRYRWARAVNHGAELTHRVEVWQNGDRQASDATFHDGRVVDQWAGVGIRRSINLTVPSTRAWLRWFDNGPFELRPYSGIRFSRLKTVEVPMGRFPIPDAAVRSRPADQVQIQQDDYFSLINGAPKPSRMSRSGLVIDHLIQLLRLGFALAPVIRIDSIDTSRAVAMSGSLPDVIASAALALNAEVYAGRDGAPVIEPANVIGPPTCHTFAGEALIRATRTPNPAATFNRVVVSSSATDIRFPLAIAEVGDPTHPAYWRKIGVKQLLIVSPLLRDHDRAMLIALTKLTKVSGRAITYTYERLPDPTIDSGDTHRGHLVGVGQRNTQVAMAAHPLKGGSQTLSTIETQWQQQP